MDLSKLSLSKKNYYAISNILQSIENARTYCSYLENNEELRWELDGMIQRFIKRVEKKVNDNF